MKKLSIKFFNKIIVLLLGLLGVSTGCKDESVEYGVPSASYEIKGVVTDKENTQPIKDIRVIRSIDSAPERWVTSYTDSEGKYSLSFGLFDAGFYLIFEDIDGEENGGNFEAKEMIVKITKADQVRKGDTWDCGAFVKVQNVELERKK